MADWYLKYASADDVRAFVEGAADARSPEEIAPDQGAANEMVECLKGAAGTQ
ncbi:hypothetical protein JOD54_004881 [Actinokineospora baliensis]|uniref:hypothetical protein n=1 Tax=Actinokineospora baliensis TaxID=547056 RepID=UPI00195ACE38|nr:hypothetical protein [Actinokineospora baliensis]MBM7774677.1 hypothetical protein [Actinokineospora baliensis]